MTDNFPLELNVVFNENCLETMKRIPDNSIDAIVTDPPYGLGKEPDALAMLKDWLETGHHDVKGKGFMGKCYHPDTEILTRDGWKCITDVNVGDFVYTLNEYHNLVLTTIEKLFEYDFDGDLIHFKHRSCEQIVTNNHNVYVCDQRLKFKFSRADSMNKSFKFYNQAIPVSGQVDYIEIGGIKYNTNWFLKLFGLYLGDGFCVNRKGTRRGIRRSDNFWGISVKKQRKIDAIQECFDNLLIPYNRRNNGDRVIFECHLDSLVEYFSQFGNAVDKYIPNNILNLPSENLIYLFAGLMESDGNITKYDQYTYSTISNKLADDMQILCLKIGYSAVKSIHKQSGNRIVCGRMCDCKVSYRLSILKPNKYLNFDARESNVIRINYVGKVNCVELTDHHVLYTRINGKPVWSGNSWDAFVPQPQIWRECLRILKPGGHLLSFGGTRTYDLVVLGLRIAGFEIREQISWVYGSGFPKSLDISKALDKMAGAERDVIGKVNNVYDGSVRNPDNHKSPAELSNIGKWGLNKTPHGLPATAPATDAAKQWQGWGTALKPAFEPIVVARKPLTGTVAENVLQWGTGGINVDGCRVGVRNSNESGWSKTGSKASANRAMSGPNYDRLAKDEAGTGRFPANFIHDGSDEVMELFPETTSGAMTREVDEYIGDSVTGFLRGKSGPSNQRADSGSAARFFYCAKASKSDRDEGLESLENKLKLNQMRSANGTGEKNFEGGFPDVIAKNHHPTVKPTSLLKYLCRLVTPPNGIIYDPFSGSGSTGKAAILEGFNFIGSELDAEYTIIANARIQYAIANKDELDEKYVLEHIEKVMPKSVPTVKDNEYF